MLYHFHHDNYSRGTALVLRGESQKAATYVSHNLSLGTLREKMVGKFVRDETPERFRVETGLIRDQERNVASRQIDLLVHDPWSQSPLYRYEDFVIVHAATARAAIEVKSRFENDGVSSLLDVTSSVKFTTRGETPVFGYALEGAKIESLAEYLKEGIEADRMRVNEKCEGHPPFLNWPDCITIQSRNIIGFRPLHGVGGDKKDWPFCFCLLDFQRAQGVMPPDVDGVETGYFLHLYDLHINKHKDLLTTGSLYQWFNEIAICDEGKLWIEPDGTIHTGPISFS